MVCMGKSSWYIAYCPLYGRCPLFGVSAKRGSTVVVAPYELTVLAAWGLVFFYTFLSSK